MRQVRPATRTGSISGSTRIPGRAHGAALPTSPAWAPLPDRGRGVRHGDRLGSAAGAQGARERRQQRARDAVKLRPRARCEIGRHAGRRMRLVPSLEQRPLHLLARLYLIPKKSAGESRIDISFLSAPGDVVEHRRFARGVGDGAMIRPLPLGDRDGQRQALRNKRDQVGHGRFVAIGSHVARRERERDAQRDGRQRGAAKANDHASRAPRPAIVISARTTFVARRKRRARARAIR